jgi:tetratricopeptide (TPR) repeat protein
MVLHKAARIAAVAGSFAAAGMAPTAASEPPTWARDVAPIVHRSCVGCHQAGGPAPFALTTYDDARSRARLIAEVTARGYMPPWLPAPGPPFAGERRLSPAEVATLTRWAEAGAPPGDLDAAPSAPAASRGWRLGEPDRVIEMPEAFVLPAGGGELFRTFVLPVGDDLGAGGGVDGHGASRRWVRSVEIRPADAPVVHHATLMVDPTDSSRRLDAASAAPGFDGMRAFSRARAPSGHLLGWTPGKAPSPGSPDLAWELEAGSDLVLELHLLPSGREESVRARVGLHFAPGPPARRPLAVRLGRKTLDIAPGESAHRVEDRFVLPAAVDVLAVYPHAHYLCRSMLATATLPDGRVVTLLEIPSWDFDWQDQYAYREPLRLPAGAELRMEFVYDNSAANPRNPRQPPQRVVYGPSSSDEMGDLWLQVATVDAADFDSLAHALDRRESDENVAGWRSALLRAPDDATLRFNLGSELVVAGSLEEGIAELERAVALDPALAVAHMNLGNALVARAQKSPEGRRDDLERAARSFERAAALGGPMEAADAHFNLANTLAALGRLEEALVHYQRALELRPGFLEARLNQAITYARQGLDAQAIVELERCLDADPAYAAALWNLALLRGRDQEGLAQVLERVERALGVEPASAQILMMRGDLLLRLDRFDEAATAYQAVLEVAPRSADAWANLARALGRLGRREEAERALRQALDLDGASAAALDVARELGP